MRKIALFVVISLVFAWAGTASAQPRGALPGVDRATREIDRSIRDQVEREIMAPPTEKPAIEEEAPERVYTGPKLFVKSIRLEGTESFPPEEFADILAPFEGREVYEEELKETVTDLVTRAYLKRGIIATCFVPPQKIVDGVVTLQVVEAKMGDLEINDALFFSAKRLGWYWPIKSGEIIHYPTMSRTMQLMNKNPDRQVKATLAPGTRPETTNVILDQKTFVPLHATASLDNEGAPSTGRLRKGLGFVHNNLLGLDDTLIGGYSGGKNFGSGYGYHKVPITPFGTTILYGYSRSKAFPKKDFERFEISSMSESYSAYVYQDLYQKDVYKGDLSVGFEMNNKRVVARTGTTNADRLRITRIGLSLLDRGRGNATYLKGQLSQGLNFPGARRKNEFSSRLAGNTFTKFNLNGQFQHVLVENIQAQVRFTGQLASEKLMPQEELYMGGLDSVRGYPAGDYLADTGFSANAELLVPAFIIPDWMRFPCGERPIKDEITGILFFDYGYGEKRGMIQGEQSRRRMASLGAGVRIRILNQASLRLEWGFPLDQMADMPTTEFARSRLHFSLSIQENLPREVERFLKCIRKRDEPEPEPEKAAPEPPTAEKPAESPAAEEVPKETVTEIEEPKEPAPAVPKLHDSWYLKREKAPEKPTTPSALGAIIDKR